MKKNIWNISILIFMYSHDADYGICAELFQKNAVLFPPAGIEPTCKNEVTRKYDLTFVELMEITGMKYY